MENIFQSIDKGLVYGANKAVKGWNWATGGTKRDLANKLLDTAAIVESVGAISASPYLAPIVPCSIFETHRKQKENIDFEKREKEVLEDGKKLSLGEYEDLKYKSLSWIIPSLAAASYCLTTDKVGERTGMGMVSGGMGLRSFSDYVMRAENLPPRKDVLTRTGEKLYETLDSLINSPELEGQLIPERNLK